MVNLLLFTALPSKELVKLGSLSCEVRV